MHQHEHQQRDGQQRQQQPRARSSGAARWRTRTCAPQSASASFASSEGCSDSPATRNQLREPLTTAPRPGTSTSDQQHQAAREQPRARRAAGAGAGRAGRPEQDEPDHARTRPAGRTRRRTTPPAAYADTADADSTMTSPRAVSSPKHREHEVQGGQRAFEPLVQGRPGLGQDARTGRALPWPPGRRAHAAPPGPLTVSGAGSGSGGDAAPCGPTPPATLRAAAANASPRAA